MSDLSELGEQQAAVSSEPQLGTVVLVSGSLDHALLAFEIATGMQAMGTQMTMWFILQGVNCLKRPRGRFAWSRWLPARASHASAGRNCKTDNAWQRVLQALNYDGATHLPLSQLNMLGVGPFVLSRIMKRKGMTALPQLIQAANELGVRFKVCQVCVDAMACDTDSDLVVEAEVSGVTRYALDVQKSHYNVVI